MNETIKGLLEECRTMIRDGIVAGYPEDELHCEPDDLLNRVTAALGDYYDIETGETEREAADAEKEHRRRLIQP